MKYNVIASTDYGSMIINRFDKNVGLNLSTIGAWEPGDINMLIKLTGILFENAPRSAKVLDIGANYGAVSIPIAKFLERRGLVLAFEAQRLVFYALAGNAALSSLENLYCHHCVISDSGGIQTIPVVRYDDWTNFAAYEIDKPSFSDYDGKATGAFEPVQSLAIDAMQLDNVLLMKIDIEGMELKALAGAVQTIRRCAPVIFVEFLKGDREALKQFLIAEGYRIYQTSRTDWLAVPHSRSTLTIEGATEIAA